MVNIAENDSFVDAWKKGYNSEIGIFGRTKGVYGGVSGYASHHKVRTGLAVVGLVAAIVLPTLYYFNKDYASFVNKLAIGAVDLAKTAVTGIGGGFKAISAFAVANPVTAILLAVAVVAAIGTLAYMNYSKSSQIEAVKEAINKDAEVKGDAPTILNSIAIAVGLAPAPATQGK